MRVDAFEPDHRSRRCDMTQSWSAVATGPVRMESIAPTEPASSLAAAHRTGWVEVRPACENPVAPPAGIALVTTPVVAVAVAAAAGVVVVVAAAAAAAVAVAVAAAAAAAAATAPAAAD